MKVYALNKNSWHYKLAKYGAGERNYPSDNFCYYFREVLLAFFKIFLHALWISIALLPLGVCSVAFFDQGVLPWEVNNRGAHVLSVLFLLEVFYFWFEVSLTGGIKLDEWQKEKRMARWEAMRDDKINRDFYDQHGYWPWQAEKPPKEPGFFGIWYKTFKEKTCVKLVFK